MVEGYREILAKGGSEWANKYLVAVLPFMFW